MGDVLNELIKDEKFKNVNFIRIEAEDFESISSNYNVEVVPTFIFLKVRLTYSKNKINYAK